jgi:hypothetical protein
MVHLLTIKYCNDFVLCSGSYHFYVCIAVVVRYSEMLL